MLVIANSTLPIGWRHLLRDTFKCQIRHSTPIKAPVIITKYSGMQRLCEYMGPDAMTRTCLVCCRERNHGASNFDTGHTEWHAD